MRRLAASFLLALVARTGMAFQMGQMPEYSEQIIHPEKRVPMLAEARQLLRRAETNGIDRMQTLVKCVDRCQQLMWVAPDDVFAEALVIVSEATWMQGKPDRALVILKEYDKILRMSGLSVSKRGAAFSERTDYQAEFLRGRIHEQKGLAALQTKDPDAARNELTEAWRWFASAAALAGRGVDSPAACKAEEVKRLIPIVRMHPLDIQTNTANQASQSAIGSAGAPQPER